MPASIPSAPDICSSSSKAKPRPDPIGKSTSSSQDPFASLPSAFDADRFQPPEWAKDMAHLARSTKDPSADEDQDDTESLGLSEQDTLWEDAREELDDGVDEASGDFTLAELRVRPSPYRRH
jgi:hypothetical protein